MASPSFTLSFKIKDSDSENVNSVETGPSPAYCE